MARINPFKDSVSAGKIGTGRFFTAGKLAGRNKAGLGGALRKAKSAGFRSFAKNLSKKDLGEFQKLIGDEMKSLPIHSSGLPYKARARIMQKAETLVRQGKISTEDKKDLRNIVNALGPNTQSPNDKTSPDPRTRAVDFKGSSRLSASSAERQPPDPETQKHIKANIKIDMAEETQGLNNTTYYHSGNILSRQKIAQENSTNDEDDTPVKSSETTHIELPHIENLPDMDIG